MKHNMDCKVSEKIYEGNFLSQVRVCDWGDLTSSKRGHGLAVIIYFERLPIA